MRTTPKGVLFTAIMISLLLGLFALSSCNQSSSSSTTQGSGSSAAVSSASSQANPSDSASGSSQASTDSYIAVFGPSDVYSQEDMQAAVDVIMAEFNTWKNVKMEGLAFTDDATCAADLEKCNKLSGDDSTQFDQAIVFVSKQQSTGDSDASIASWNPNTDYNGYTWHLARVNGGEWKLLAWD